MQLIKNLCKIRLWGQDLMLLIIRLWMANIFLRSGLLKLSSWESTLSLFQDDYHVPFLPTQLAAVMGTSAEITGGILVLLGLLTPFGAFILFGVTAVIELFVYPGTTDHYHWLMLLSVLVLFGGGKFSIDGLVFNRKL